MNIDIGDFYLYKKIFSQNEVNEFARISGDNNPIHLDKNYAKETIFKETIVHGLFASSIFSMIIGTKFPGIGSIYLEQNLSFKRPIYPNQEHSFLVKVIKKRKDKSIYTLQTLCLDFEEKICIEGLAVVLKK